MGKHTGSEFFAWSDMTLILDREKSFKVTAHSLTKGSLYMQYEPDWTNGR